MTAYWYLCSANQDLVDQKLCRTPKPNAVAVLALAATRAAHEPVAAVYTGTADSIAAHWSAFTRAPNPYTNVRFEKPYRYDSE